MARKLLRHRMTQVEAARRLGLTQQAISNYSLGSRGLARYLRRIKTVDRLTDSLVQAVLQGKDEIRVTLMLSRICDYILSRNIVCSHMKPRDHCPICSGKVKGCEIRLLYSRAMKEASPLPP